MDSDDKFTVIMLVACLIAFLCVIIVIAFTPSENTVRYSACIKVAKNITDCEHLLINN